jgi:FkbM family methyltransferase
MDNKFSKFRIFMDSRKIFSNWQILPKVYYKTTDDEFAIFKTKSGLQIKIRVKSTDLMALVNVWIKNEYEIDNFSIKDDDSIIDIGGHIGLFSLLVSQKSNANVYSFEPIEDNFNLLKTNLEINNIKNVFPFNLAVTKNLDEVNLFLSDDESAHSIISKESKSIMVKSISLQKIFDENKIDTCKLLKLDCEGAEYEIIKSLPSEYLDKIQNMAIEYHLADSRPDLVNNLIAKIKQSGFNIKTREHYNDMGFLIAKR